MGEEGLRMFKEIYKKRCRVFNQPVQFTFLIDYKDLQILKRKYSNVSKRIRELIKFDIKENKGV